MPRVWGALRPTKFLWLSTCAHTVWETTTTFCISNYIDVRKIFTRLTANSDSRPVCCSITFLLLLVYGVVFIAVTGFVLHCSTADVWVIPQLTTGTAIPKFNKLNCSQNAPTFTVCRRCIMYMYLAGAHTLPRHIRLPSGEGTDSVGYTRPTYPLLYTTTWRTDGFQPGFQQSRVPGKPVHFGKPWTRV